MAKIQNPGATGQPDKGAERAINVVASAFLNAPLKPVSAGTINGSPYFYDTLEKLEKYYKYFKAGGYITAPVTDIETTMKEAQAAVVHIHKEFDPINADFDTSHYYFEDDDDAKDVLMLTRDLDIPDGAWWYSYESCLHHTPFVRDALISALSILGRQFMLATETMDWDVFQDKDYYMSRWDGEDDDETKQQIIEYHQCVEFYNTDPIKLKWHAKAFHYHARRNTPLGDWLRCVWHYRKFKWKELLPQLLYEEMDDTVTIYDCFGISYNDDDMLSKEIRYSIDEKFNNCGYTGLMDYRALTEKRVLHEPMFTMEQTKKIAIDFTKMWTFDLDELCYQQLYRTVYDSLTHRKREAIPLPIINKNEYDYRPRKLRTKAVTDSVRRTKRQQQNLRGRNNADRRNARRKQAAVA